MYKKGSRILKKTERGEREKDRDVTIFLTNANNKFFLKITGWRDTALKGGVAGGGEHMPAQSRIASRLLVRSENTSTGLLKASSERRMDDDIGRGVGPRTGECIRRRLLRGLVADINPRTQKRHLQEGRSEEEKNIGAGRASPTYL